MARSEKLIACRLSDLYGRLRGHFGYAPKWWPGSPLEIALTAILVQQCDWSAAWKGVRRLAEQGLLSLPALACVDPAKVQPCIREVAFAPTKSKRLVSFAQAILARQHEQIETYLAPSVDTQTLRADLLSLSGIGEETADCMLLYASHHATFVVDAYTRRVLQRLGLFPELGSLWIWPYGGLKQFFEHHIRIDFEGYAGFAFTPEASREVALFRDFHAQFVELGKHHCLKMRPRCRVSGQKGWTDYAVCEPHCRENECQACPLSQQCAMAAAL